MGKIFIISGPSGAGEDSIINGLEKIMPIERIITTTTREKRIGETEGRPYYFISREEFIRRRDEGGFFEWAEQYNSNLYGVTFEEIERIKKSKNIGIWKIEYKGVIAAKKLMPDIVSIFVNCPINQLAERIKKRDGISDEYLAERMAYTEEWLRHTDVYKFSVNNENGKLEEAVKEAAELILHNL